MEFRAPERVVESRGRRFLLRVETSSTPADYEKYDDLRNAIWGFPEDHMAGARNLMCECFVHEGSSLFIGAFAEEPGRGFPRDRGHMVGFCYGFVGLADPARGFRDPSNLRFYSQYAGVRPAWHSHGLGIALKELQRETLLGTYGVETVVCTYDPLTGVNARRNVHHFGMEVLDYRVATYGEYGGLLNRLDVPTDRFFMSWDLRRPARGPEAGGNAAAGLPAYPTVAPRRVAGASGPVDLETVTSADLPASPGPRLLLRIPSDFYRMLRETAVPDPDVRRIPLDWRLATRSLFRELLGRGYRVADFLKDAGDPPGNAYLLERV